MSAASPCFRRTSGGVTHPGAVRTANEDAYLDRPDLGLWAVADGMGGHSHGGMASRLLVDRLTRIGHHALLGSAVAAIRGVLSEVNAGLVKEAGALRRGPIGSTIVVLVAVGDHCAILWAGDSRAYRLREGRLLQLSFDHTHVLELVAKGIIRPEQAEHHPMSHVLMRAVGGDEELLADCQIEAIRAGDRFLLCSDGLVKELSVERICEGLSGNSQAAPAEAAARLVQMALDAGGRDNITALVVDFEHV